LKELAKHLDLPADSSTKNSGDKNTPCEEKMQSTGEDDEVHVALPSEETSRKDKDSPALDEEQPVKASAPPLSRASTAGSMLYSGATSLGRGASSLGRSAYSLGGKIATPVANTVSSVSSAVSGSNNSGDKSNNNNSGDNGEKGEKGPKLLPRELKGLIGDVVLLGAPLDPKVMCGLLLILN